MLKLYDKDIIIYISRCNNICGELKIIKINCYKTIFLIIIIIIIIIFYHGLKIITN